MLIVAMGNGCKALSYNLADREDQALGISMFQFRMCKLYKTNVAKNDVHTSSKV